MNAAFFAIVVVAFLVGGYHQWSWVPSAADSVSPMAALSTAMVDAAGGAVTLAIGSGLASERYLSTLHSRGIPAPSTRADAPCRSCLDRPQFYALVASFRTTIPYAQSFRGQREST